MLQQLLWVLGLEQLLQSIRDRTEKRAQDLIQFGKARAIQASVGVALITSAITLLLMALVPGLIALFLWLRPQLGDLASLAIVSGVLAGLAAILAVSALVTFNRKTGSLPLEPAKETPGTGSPAIQHLPSEAVSGPAAVSAKEVDAFLSLAGRFTRVPQTGIQQIDDLVLAVTPKAEEATKEAVARAATLMRTGDTGTVLTVLGAAAAAGWLMTKAIGPRSDTRAV